MNKTTPILFLLIFWLGSSAWGFFCERNVREAGFILRNTSQPHILGLVFDGASPEKEKLKGRIKLIKELHFFDSNIVPEIIDLKEEHRFKEHVELLGLAQFPAAVLISPANYTGTKKRTQILEAPDKEGFTDLYFTRLSGMLLSSPLQIQLSDLWIGHHCMLIHAQGNDPKTNQAARTAELRTTIEKEAKRVGAKRPVKVFGLRSNDKTEKVLLKALGLWDVDGKASKVALVFAKGRQLDQTLDHRMATRRYLEEKLRLLTLNCTCSNNPEELMESAFPIRWNEEQRKTAKDDLGFDPDTVEALREVSEVWWNVGDQVSDGESGTGYIEIAIEDLDDPLESVAKAQSEPEPPVEISTQGVPPPQTTGVSLIMVLAGGVALLIFAVVVWTVMSKSGGGKS